MKRTMSQSCLSQATGTMYSYAIFGMKIEERLGRESDFDLCICKRICDGACGFKRFGKIRDSSRKTEILPYETGVILGNKLKQ